MSDPAYLERLRLRPGADPGAGNADVMRVAAGGDAAGDRGDEAAPEGPGFPFSLPFVSDLDLRFRSPVTFFVGENGSGKSTLLEAIADLCGLPVGGGGKNEIGAGLGPERESELASGLRASFASRPKNGYFFRAEFQALFASLLDERAVDPDFGGDPYGRYGGRSLHTRSHGEAFLAMFGSWMSPGIILMDEPESALSPQRQLSLLLHMKTLENRGEAQFIVATHSALLLTYPGATLVTFDEGELREIDLEESSHYQITKGVLEHPELYWQHLLRQLEEERGEEQDT